MHYTFPKITHINDILPAIEGSPEFIVAERDGYKVVNYMVNQPDTFPEVTDYNSAARRECRGIIFDTDGNLISRRLHKFFNCGERDETQIDKIDLSKPHVILEKLDGSMITPIPLGVYPNQHLRWGTKMGVTEVALQAEEFVASRPHYTDFAWLHIERNQTTIFEWCSRQQKIVLDYPEDRLVLLAIRDNVTGEYKSYEQLKTYAESYGIPVVQQYPGTVANMEHLVSETKSLENSEGWIIRFDDGTMLKIKSDWYLRIHKTKDNLNFEKNVIDLIINDAMDDAKSFMLAEDRHRVERFEKLFWEGVANTVEIYDRYFTSVVAAGLDRKEYALRWMPTIKDQDPYAPGIVFGKFNNRDTREMVLDIIKKNISTQTKVDSVRNMWRGHRWSYKFESEA
jgi:RNA ligase